jgi:hypothetical protein
MLLHARAKTLNFVEKGILVILLSQRPNSQRKAPFDALSPFLRHVLHALPKIITFVKIGILII